jgi:hypothetical protein
VNPNQVLFYMPGSASNILQTGGNADTAGIFLVPDGGIQINAGVDDSEFISGGPISFHSNPQVVPAPEIGRGPPGILAVGGLLFGAKLLERSWMRHRPRTAVNHAAA